MKKILLSMLAMLMTVSISAQLLFPPSFGGDTLNIRQDKMTRAYITPLKIVWSQNVKDADLLLKPNTGQSDLFKSGMCRMESNGPDKACLILDFGRELHGGIKLVISDCTPLKTPSFRIRFGESLSETCSELNTGKSIAETGSVKEVDLQNNTATNDHAIRDMVLTVPYYGQIELGNSGFRFVRLDLLDSDMVVNLKEATAVFRYRNIPYLGSFKCSDDRLNKIWMTGAYTVHLNMQEYIWDGIKRDRLVWLGDMHPETSTISKVFGDEESFYASLDLACQQWPLPNWMNGMSAYSMWYMIIQYEWYQHYGNIDFIKKHGDYIKGLIDLLDTKIAEDGTETLSPFRFLDWPSSSNQKGVEAGYRALLCWALQDGKQLCSLLGDEARANKCVLMEQRMRKKVLPPNDLKQAAALMSIAGLMEPEKASQEYLLVGGPKGFSTFYGYYMLEALAKSGHYEEAMDIISQYWGGMLDMGATSFWEDFDLEWTKDAGRIDEFVPKGKKDIHGDFGAYCYPGFRHSFCHGWASGPTAWMSQHVLGVEILEPGCKKIRINPHLGKLQWAEGTYPTPMGVIQIRHEKRPDGTINTSVKAPKGIKIIK